MEKEKILEMSRQENKEKDIVALEAETQACKYAMIFGGILAIILLVWQLLATGEINTSLVALSSFFLMVMEFYIYFKLKRKKNLTNALFWTFLAILDIIHAIISFYN